MNSQAKCFICEHTRLSADNLLELHMLLCHHIEGAFIWGQSRLRIIGMRVSVCLGATVQVEDIGPKISAYIYAPACQTRTRLRLWHTYEIRAESKFISIYELGFCSPIVVILLSVLMAVNTGYSAMLTPSRTKDIKTSNFLLRNHTTSGQETFFPIHLSLQTNTTCILLVRTTKLLVQK